MACSLSHPAFQHLSVLYVFTLNEHLMKYYSYRGRFPTCPALPCQLRNLCMGLHKEPHGIAIHC